MISWTEKCVPYLVVGSVHVSGWNWSHNDVFLLLLNSEVVHFLGEDRRLFHVFNVDVDGSNRPGVTIVWRLDNMLFNIYSEGVACLGFIVEFLLKQRKTKGIKLELEVRSKMMISVISCQDKV